MTTPTLIDKTTICDITGATIPVERTYEDGVRACIEALPQALSWQTAQQHDDEVRQALEALIPAPVGHWSDCAVHNEPAMPAGPCDCGGIELSPDHDTVNIVHRDEMDGKLGDFLRSLRTNP